MLCTIGLLVTCGRPSQKQLLKRIAAAEEVLMKDSLPVRQHALDAAQTFMDYITAFPDDTSSNPRFWFKAAELYNVAELPEKAIALTDSFMKYYPEHPFFPYVLHFRGAVYELSLYDTRNATIAYEQIISDYNTPEHYELVTSALASLQYMGMSADEIFEDLKSKGLIQDE